MTLLILGINHKTAPVDVRERVAFAPEAVADVLGRLQQELPVAEAAVLSTCNRTEVYVSGEVTDAALTTWMANFHGVDGTELASCCYQLRDADAVRHMMKVASGLDSMVLGEPQILGQIKSAYVVAQELGAMSSALDQAFQQVFTAAKRVRTETAIGRNPVSVAFAAVSLSRQIFTSLSEVHALLIGAGETIELVARHLLDNQVGSITFANRTLSRAQELAEVYGAEAILLSDIPEHLHRADMVISSTASQLPILGKGAVESALKLRKRRPMLMVDIAVPRDIEPEVARLDDVYLYTVDDLQEVIDENLRSREDAASKAETIINEEVERWQRQRRVRGASGTIRAFRNSASVLRDAELRKAINALSQGQSAETVLRQLAHGLTNKLLHTPTARMKQASAEGRDEHLRWAHELFDLDTESDINTDTKPGSVDPKADSSLGDDLVKPDLLKSDLLKPDALKPTALKNNSENE